MTNLGMREDQQEDLTNKEEYISELARNDDDILPLKKSVPASSGLHILFGILLIVTPFILKFLNIPWLMFDKPPIKTKDIEFVLVDNPEQKPINKNTKYRADRNTRAGGKHNPKKKISEPKPRAAKAKPQKKAAPPKPAIKRPAPKVAQKPTVRPKTPAPPRPTPHRVVSKPKITPPRAFSVPVPITKVPKAVTPNSGPVTSGPVTQSRQSTSAPRPIMSLGSYGSPGNSIASSSYSLGGGRAGNPGPGNPTGRPGIDAIKEPDFGPWMRDLQRRIKRNWDPPRGNESKRVVVFFKVAKDGRLLTLRVAKASGVPSADQAAISAIQLTAPFRPLPPEYRKPDVEIQFTFDYNVFGGSRY